MFFNLLILFTLVPAMELYLLISVGSVIGPANTILIIILTGAAGATLARIQGYSVLAQIQQSLNRGEMPTDAMLDGLMIFCGGIVLLTPGFITDALGFLLLIPLTRRLLKVQARRWMTSKINQGETVVIKTSTPPPRQDAEDADYWE